jgi:acetyltransferase
MTNATQTAEHLKPYAKLGDKPVLASWMGGPEIAAGERILNAAGIPTFPYPDTAARMFTYMWKYTHNLRGIYETPSYRTDHADIDRAKVEEIIGKARSEDRTILTEFESKQVLASYGIPTVETRIATTEEDAVQAAEEIGFPVVLKLFSETITHKTDVGGVQLNIRNVQGVRQSFNAIKSAVAEKVGPEHFLGVTVQPMIKLDGYEVILGSSIDPQFGPVILFGLGGQLVEVFKDRALGLPPLNTTLARRMMEQTRIYKALKGVRGRQPVDLDALEQLMVKFSQLVAEQRWIREIDINPLLASPGKLVALDARVVVFDRNTAEEQLPKLSIRPYPIQYVDRWTAKDGSEMVIRPIRPEDEPAMAQFHETLSDRTVYLRYLQLLKLSQRVAHERLTRICFIDYDREMALVAERTDAAAGTSEIVGVGRLQKIHGANEAEFAIVISDAYQGKGIGHELLKRLLQVARDEKIARVRADILADNMNMQRLCDAVGFKLHREISEPTVEAVLDLV